MLTLSPPFVNSQWPLFEGHEGPLFDALLQLRSLPRPVVRQATTALCSTASAQLSPIFALYTLSSTLRALLPPPSPSDAQRGLAFSADADAVAQPFAFGLLELGRVVMRLPAEVVSEELPRLRDLILPVRRAVLLESLSSGWWVMLTQVVALACDRACTRPCCRCARALRRPSWRPSWCESSVSAP